MKLKDRITDENIITVGTLIGFIYFFIMGIMSIAEGNYEIIFDKFFEAVLFMVLFLVHKKLKLSVWTIAIAASAIMLHDRYLYGNVYFGIPFDHIIHFVAGFAVCVLFYQILLNSYKKPNLIGVLLLSVVLAMGLTSSMETLEFIGYSFLGEGEGILFYGTGDFGEWNNMSWDMICNTLGAIAGAFAYSSFTVLRKKFSPSKTI